MNWAAEIMEIVVSGASRQTSANQLFEKEAEFRKETIYFIVIDRFFNGNRANDGVSKQGLHDPSLTHWVITGVVISRGLSRKLTT
jgi:cyclomaltodextrin glucanotransferase